MYSQTLANVQRHEMKKQLASVLFSYYWMKNAMRRTHPTMIPLSSLPKPHPEIVVMEGALMVVNVTTIEIYLWSYEKKMMRN